MRTQTPIVRVRPDVPPTARLRALLTAERGGLDGVDDGGVRRVWDALPPDEQRRLLAADIPAETHEETP